MACFLVPVAEAVVTTIVAKALKSREQAAAKADGDAAPKTALSTKLSWLNKLLWGGSFLLAFEHVWHGEVTPWFPFLTAMSSPEDASEMFHEMMTVGVSMAVLVTLVWCGMVAVSSAIEKQAARKEVEA